MNTWCNAKKSNGQIYCGKLTTEWVSLAIRVTACCTLHTACSFTILFFTHLMTATGSSHDGTKAPMLAAASAHGGDAAAAVAAAVMSMARPAVAAGPRPLRVAIIGGGIGGLGAAICLQRAGEGRRRGGGGLGATICLQRAGEGS